MPYKRVGKTVYKKSGGKWVKKGSSKNIATAKKYLAVLNMREHDIPPKRKRRKRA